MSNKIKDLIMLIQEHLKHEIKVLKDDLDNQKVIIDDCSDMIEVALNLNNKDFALAEEKLLHMDTVPREIMLYFMKRVGGII